MNETLDLGFTKLTITQRFGERPQFYSKYGMRGHNGIDFVNAERVNYCLKAGKVSKVAYDGGYGNACRVLTDDGNEDVYGHFAMLPKVKVGDRVDIGQRLGQMGTTGDSSGVHCHYGERPADHHNSGNGYAGYVDNFEYLKSLTNQNNLMSKEYDELNGRMKKVEAIIASFLNVVDPRSWATKINTLWTEHVKKVEAKKKKKANQESKK